MCAGCYLPRTAQQPYFGRAFYQPQVVQCVIQVGEFPGGHRTGGYLAANSIDPGHNLLVKVYASAHGVINTLPPLQQAGKNFVYISYGKGIVRGMDVTNTFQPRSKAVP